MLLREPIAIDFFNEKNPAKEIISLIVLSSLKTIPAFVGEIFVEDNIREFLSEKYGLREGVIQSGDFDIDGCLMRFKKPIIVLESKWKKINKNDVLLIEENLKKIDSDRKILFVPNKTGIKSNLEVIDVDDLMKLKN